MTEMDCYGVSYRKGHDGSSGSCGMVYPQPLKDAVDVEGEVHAIIEEHDKELEIRKGQVSWDTNNGNAFTIMTPKYEPIVVEYDRVIRFYVPAEVWH